MQIYSNISDDKFASFYYEYDVDFENNFSEGVYSKWV